MSDRDKGLLAADHILGEQVTRLTCCFHLHQNFKRFRNVEHLFWPLANSKSPNDFLTKMAELEELHAPAAEYLRRIDSSLWVTAYITGCSFGHKTSNVVESMNQVLKSEWELSILDLLNEIWHILMNTRYQRFTIACRAEEDQLHTDFALTKLLESRQWASRNRVRIATRTTAEVIQANEKAYTVNLLEKICSCGHFQENGIPCGHAFSFIQTIHEAPRNYLPAYFQTTTWKNTYRHNIKPISLDMISNIEVNIPNLPDIDCAPPTKLRCLQGRPRNKRLLRSSQKKRTARAQAVLNNDLPPPDHGPGSQQCGKCGSWGHNRKSCRNIPL